MEKIIPPAATDGTGNEFVFQLYCGGKAIQTIHFEIVEGLKLAFVNLAQAEIDKLEKQLSEL